MFYRYLNGDLRLFSSADFNIFAGVVLLNSGGGGG